MLLTTNNSRATHGSNHPDGSVLAGDRGQNDKLDTCAKPHENLLDMCYTDKLACRRVFHTCTVIHLKRSSLYLESSKNKRRDNKNVHHNVAQIFHFFLRCLQSSLKKVDKNLPQISICIYSLSAPASIKFLNFE